MIKHLFLLFFSLASYAIRVDVAYVCNDAYVHVLAASMESLILNSAHGNDLRIYVLHPDFSVDTVTKLHELVSDKAKLELIKFDINKLSGAPDGFHIMAYAKCLLPEVLPKLDKILFLDVDTLVLSDLGEFFKTPLNDSYLAAIQDEQYMEKIDFYDNRWQYNSIYQDVKKWFNSGVMLLNLKKCRKDKITESFLFNMRHIPHYIGDQPIFNYLFHGSVVYVDPRWNAASISFISPEYRHKYSVYTSQQIKQAYENPAILHLSGRGYVNARHPLAGVFQYFLHKTPWRGKMNFVSNEMVVRLVHKMSLFEFLKIKLKIQYLIIRDFFKDHFS